MALPFPIPRSLVPGFSLSRATTADIDAMVEVYYESFLTDPRNTFWWSPNKVAMFVWMKRRMHRKMNDHSVRHFKITDAETGELVAFARWDIPKGYETAFGAWVGDEATTINVTPGVAVGGDVPQEGEHLPLTSASAEATNPPTIDFPEGAQSELCRDFFNTLSRMSVKQDAKSMLGE